MLIVNITLDPHIPIYYNIPILCVCLIYIFFILGDKAESDNCLFPLHLGGIWHAHNGW